MRKSKQIRDVQKEKSLYASAFQAMLQHAKVYLELGSTLDEMLQGVQSYREVYESVLDIDYSMKKVTYNQRVHALKGVKAAISWLKDVVTVRFSRNETA